VGRDLRDLDVLALRRSVRMVLQRPTVFAGTVRESPPLASRIGSSISMCWRMSGLRRRF
jgi:ABC-type phosphate transport system ATPase subunit